MTALLDGVTTGVTGQRWRATITSCGDIVPWDPAAPGWRWFIAADDRWHIPFDETAVRQRRIGGTPVVETRVRIPDGDALQRVWSVADQGGLTMIEFENDSPRPFAIALTGGNILTERPPVAVPVEGIELPGPAVVIPVGHRSSARVAIAHGIVSGHSILPTSLPSASAVVSGWSTLCDRASRLGLPDQALVDEVVAARCTLLLEGPCDVRDPLSFLFDVAHIARVGGGASDWLPHIADPIAAIARNPDPAVDDALDGVERLAVLAGDDRAAGDISDLRQRRGRDHVGAALRTSRRLLPSLEGTRSLGAYIDGVERCFASGGDLLAGGIPDGWLGSNFEVHALPNSPRATVSFAVRWHGDRPALLWEQSGDATRLSASAVDPGWTATAVHGETLLAAQHQNSPRRASQ